MDTLPVDDDLRLRAGEVAPERPDGAIEAGEAYVVERRTAQGWTEVGEAGLADEVLTLEIAAGSRRQGMGRRVLLRLVDRARVLGWVELRVTQIGPADEAARALLMGLGFVARPGDPTTYVVRLAPLGRARP